MQVTQKKPELTDSLLLSLREELRGTSAQVVDTHDEIDLTWLRANKTIEGHKKALLTICDWLDDDVNQIRRAQAFVREVLSDDPPKI